MSALGEREQAYVLGSQVRKLLTKRDEARAECDRLRAALKVYADEESWIAEESWGVKYAEFIGGGNVSEPWLLAREALTPAPYDDATKETLS